jgi:hypothetical protein
MRTRPCIATLVTAIFACGHAVAADRAACVAACETAAQVCMTATHDTYDACKPAANRGCASALPADKFRCLTTALKACSAARSSGTDSCRTAHGDCHAACGPRPADTYEFWCELDADSVATATQTRKQTVCTGTPGQSPREQQDHCMKQLTPTDPAMGFSLDCEPLG